MRCRGDRKRKEVKPLRQPRGRAVVGGQRRNQQQTLKAEGKKIERIVRKERWEKAR